MFVDAIEKVSGFTRPIMFITRNYNSSEIIPGLGTLFFVNGDGVAVTCKHVANMMLNADKVNANYAAFKKETPIVSAYCLVLMIPVVPRLYSIQVAYSTG